MAGSKVSAGLTSGALKTAVPPNVAETRSGAQWRLYLVPTRRRAGSRRRCGAKKWIQATASDPLRGPLATSPVHFGPSAATGRCWLWPVLRRPRPLKWVTAVSRSGLR